MKAEIVANGLGEIVQHGYVVTDAEKSAIEWFDRIGAGPFYMGDVTLDNYVYRGVPTECELKIAIGYWGGIQIELIEPLNEADMLYTRALPAEAGKLNHFATHVSDLDALLESRNLKNRVLQSGAMLQSGVKFVYLENFMPGGHHLELIQAPESMLVSTAGMVAARSRWDGAKPVRPMTALAEDLAALNAS